MSNPTLYCIVIALLPTVFFLGAFFLFRKHDQERERIQAEEREYVEWLRKRGL